MSDNDKKNEKHNEDEGGQFDMYHLFSRKDVVALVFMILLLLAYVVYQAFFTAQLS